MDAGATLTDIREAATTLEEIEPIARRVLGGAHPTTRGIEVALRDARAALHARETPSGGRVSFKYHKTYEERLGVGVVRKDPLIDRRVGKGAAAWKRNIGPGVELRSGGGAAAYS